MQNVISNSLFDWFDNNLAVFCIAKYAKRVNNDVSKQYTGVK